MNLTIHEELPEQVFEIDRAKLRAYADASGDQNPIHQDEEFAKSVGLPNVIAHGMYTMALAGEAVRRWVGDDRSVVEFSARFTKPVVVPADVKVRISFSGKVSGVSHNEVSIDVNALCDGVKVLGQTKVRVRL